MPFDLLKNRLINNLKILEGDLDDQVAIVLISQNRSLEATECSEPVYLTASFLLFSLRCKYPRALPARFAAYSFSAKLPQTPS